MILSRLKQWEASSARLDQSQIDNYLNRQTDIQTDRQTLVLIGRAVAT